MKRFLIVLLAFSVILSLASCSLLDDILGEVTDSSSDGADKPDGDGGSGEKEGYLYSAFTSQDKALLERYLGYVIPFAPSDEYYIEGYYDVDDYENGINYYTVGNTASDFEAYRAEFSSYKYIETYRDTDGSYWYVYEKNGVLIEIAFYTLDGETYIDVFACLDTESENGSDNNGSDNNGSDNQGGNEGGNDGGSDNGSSDSSYRYTDFTASEKELLETYLGYILPFAPTDEYYIEGYYDVDDYENGINYYTVGNTAADFTAYKALFSSYTFLESYEDDYGDTWYAYQKNDLFVDIAFYTYEGETYIDVFAYSDLSEDDYEDEEDYPQGGGNEGGSDINEGNLLKNDGAGLPSSSTGVYEVDFTDGKYVRDVTDQGYYMDGCPTVGDVPVLVIPVQFTDATAAGKGYTVEKLMKAFNGGAADTDYYSLHDYFYISSYGKLDLDITVVDTWFCPKYTSSYYAKQTMDYYGDSVFIGDQMILDEALSYLATFMDLSAFDSDNNGYIDAVVMINTLSINPDSDFNWAYRYWNIYTDSEDELYEYDGVSANDYLWAQYGFLYETVDALGNSSYSDSSVMNTYTFIHEFSHVLGIDDYYDTTGEEGPLLGCDVMDVMAGDHNPFSKFNLGWLTAADLIVTDGSVTVELSSFSESGDAVIIANDFDEELGAYQEYYIVIYYTAEGLNGGDAGYFLRDGIVVYHVNATLYYEDYEGERYYDIYNNNTSPSDSYGTEDNLIEFVLSGDENITYIAGDSLPETKTDSGDALEYTFTVVSIEEDSATVTFEYIG